MKQFRSIILVSLIAISFLTYAMGQELTATEIIRRADKKAQGTSSESTMTMKIVRPTWDRTVTFKNWTKGRDYALTLITSPAKEKGQSFLKLKTEMWNWNPTISRMIKLPPSMMSQGWMGSDYSNDDILKESSIVVDYNHKLIGSEKVQGYECYKIQLIPKDDAAVVWGKIIKWITKDELLQMKSEYYDEDGYLIKTDFSYDIKKMHDRVIPTRFVIVPADEEGHKTIVIINTMKFDIEIKDSFFSQQNMKRVR